LTIWDEICSIALGSVSNLSTHGRTRSADDGRH
jgi:hypothetical protein